MAQASRPCTVDGCEKPRHGKIYCSGHRGRWVKYGDPLAPLLRQPNVGTCTVPGCDEPMRKTGWCASHYAQRQRTGEAPAPFKWKWGSDDVGYTGVHVRLRTQRGRADAQSCQHCGDRAAQWAYDHADPDERLSKYGIFSIRLNHYVPLCPSCHKRFDITHR